MSLARRRRWLSAPGFGLFLDNYKMCIESERMNVLAIYLPCRKFGIASDFRKVKTAVPEGTYIHTYIQHVPGTCVEVPVYIYTQVCMYRDTGGNNCHTKEPSYLVSSQSRLLPKSKPSSAAADLNFV